MTIDICLKYVVINREPTKIDNEKAEKDDNTCKKKKFNKKNQASRVATRRTTGLKSTGPLCCLTWRYTEK